MAKDNLVKLIDQIPEIKKQFKTESETGRKTVGDVVSQAGDRTIHNDEQYLLWKAEIEAELEKLSSSKTIEDIYGLFRVIKRQRDEETAFVQLEAKLKALGKMLSESGGEIKMDRSRKLFISHSSKDADYIEAFVGLLEILGLQDEEIICSSIPPYCIPLGNKVYEWLVHEFQQSELHVVYALSEDYYASAASLNEMGAAWTMQHKWTGILLPGFSFEQVTGCIDKTQISIKLDDQDQKMLRHRLGEFKDGIIKEFELRSMSEATWERRRDEFLEKITVITEKRAQKNAEIIENEQQYIPVVGKQDVDSIPVEPAFLLVYAASGNGQILRLATLGSPVQIYADGKEFLADDTPRESARWQEALDRLIEWRWVKPVGRKGEVFEVTGTGYDKADWLKAGMDIDTTVEPLEELKHFIC